ncbi:WD-40 repeat-containing protein [Mycena galopus ATCC 62051]|nr:WD-40 repeat-containing protein [Mycena galopus ATCC 62051]
MSSPAPASPTHLIRSHSSDVTALFFSDDNERLYSGDASGRVVVTSTRSLRAIVSWLAHTDGIMGVQEWGSRIVTHSRDHKLHVWTRVEDLPASARVGGSAVLSDLPTPVLCYSLDVNALNYCRFSLLPSPSNPDEGLIALPNLVESSEADIWVLPSKQRIHASVGTERTQPMFSLGGREGMRTGLIMSMHLFRTTPPAEGPSARTGELRLLGAYEDGSVALRRFVDSTGQTSVEGRGWEIVWKYKLHVEAIMAMRVSRDNRLALTVSADHLVGRYDLATEAGVEGDAGVSPGTVHRTSHPGNGCVAIRDDGRVCAIGGWDGKIRLYSTKNLKSLGTLRYHKSGCQAVEFARSVEDPAPAGEKDDEDEEMTAEELEARGRWLAAGAKDHRVSLWALISFGKA